MDVNTDVNDENQNHPPVMATPAFSKQQLKNNAFAFSDNDLSQQDIEVKEGITDIITQEQPLPNDLDLNLREKTVSFSKPRDTIGFTDAQ